MKFNLFSFADSGLIEGPILDFSDASKSLEILEKILGIRPPVHRTSDPDFKALMIALEIPFAVSFDRLSNCSIVTFTNVPEPIARIIRRAHGGCIPQYVPAADEDPILLGEKKSAAASPAVDPATTG